MTTPFKSGNIGLHSASSQTFGMINMKNEFSYTPFENLAVSLRKDGLTKEADILHHRLHVVAWTTGSELIDELSQRIKIIRKNEYDRLSEESKNNFMNAVDMIRSALPNFEDEQEN